MMRELILVTMPAYKSYWASCPPYNGRVFISQAIKKIDVPCYGPRTSKGVFDIISQPRIKVFATKKLRVKLPKYTINTTIQNKIPHKVKGFLEESEKHPKCQAGSQNFEAIQRVKAFVRMVHELTMEQVPDLATWRAKILEHIVVPEWDTRLHVKHILELFGFDLAAAAELGAMPDPGSPGKTMYENALRWLSKGFECYGLPGTVADVVNLIMAIMRLSPDKECVTQDWVEARLEEFAVWLEQGAPQGDMRVEDRVVNTSSWKIPDALIHDGEMDDKLSWTVLEYIHSIRGSKLTTYVQLATNSSLDELEQLFKEKEMIVLRDPDSRNAGVVLQAWSEDLAEYISQDLSPSVATS
jgi:hypothetical protein